jgi:hypothetical protein
MPERIALFESAGDNHCSQIVSDLFRELAQPTSIEFGGRHRSP